MQTPSTQTPSLQTPSRHGFSYVKACQQSRKLPSERAPNGSGPYQPSGSSHRLRSYRGFTLVELLIVIAIIGTLMGLLLPAVNAARERSRQLTCNNNLGQLSKALISIATTGKGTFPGWMQQQRLAAGVADQYDDGSGNNQPVDIEVSWAAKLLPQLDRAADWDSLLMGNLGHSNDLTAAPDNMPKIDVFLCPSDVRTNPEEAGITYIVNAGAPDLGRTNANNNASDHKANGICHDLRTSSTTAPLNPQGPTVRFGADIKDGGSTTLLLSENVHKDASDTLNTTWLRTAALVDSPSTGVQLTRPAEQVFGMVWVYDSPGTPANALAPTTQARFNRDPTTPNSYSALNEAFARPASEHPELFLVAFVGGNTRSIRDSIEYRVYQQLMTPNGAKCVWPTDLSINFSDSTGSDYVPAFHNADPTSRLSDSDY